MASKFASEYYDYEQRKRFLVAKVERDGYIIGHVC